MSSWNNRDLVSEWHIGIEKSNGGPIACSFEFFLPEREDDNQKFQRNILFKESMPKIKDVSLIYNNHNNFDDAMNLTGDQFITVYYGIFTLNENTNLQVENSTKHWNFGVFLDPESNRFSDVKIICGDKEFNCHKIIVCSASPVLDKMLSHGFKESQESKIIIPDIKAETMKQVLNFMYKGTIFEDPSEDYDLDELLKSADKYDIENLGELVSEQMEKNLGLENVLNLLSLAQLYRNKRLKKACFDFLSKKENFEKVRRNASPEMETLMDFFEFQLSN